MFGVQAVEHGFISLCLEQRGMGESISATQEGKEKPKKCIHTAMTALALGRTILGERVWDISRAIDVLGQFEHLGLDLDKILITGPTTGAVEGVITTLRADDTPSESAEKGMEITFPFETPVRKNDSFFVLVPR